MLLQCPAPHSNAGRGTGPGIGPGGVAACRVPSGSHLRRGSTAGCSQGPQTLLPLSAVPHLQPFPLREKIKTRSAMQRRKALRAAGGAVGPQPVTPSAPGGGGRRCSAAGAPWKRRTGAPPRGALSDPGTTPARGKNEQRYRNKASKGRKRRSGPPPRPPGTKGPRVPRGAHLWGPRPPPPPPPPLPPGAAPGAAAVRGRAGPWGRGAARWARGRSRRGRRCRCRARGAARSRGGAARRRRRPAGRRDRTGRARARSEPGASWCGAALRHSLLHPVAPSIGGSLTERRRAAAAPARLSRPCRAAAQRPQAAPGAPRPR